MGEDGQAPETQGACAPAGAQGERGGKAREGRDRRARQQPGGPWGTWGGREQKAGDRGASGCSHSSRLGSRPKDSPPQVSAAVRAEEERDVRRPQTAQYQALAHLEDKPRH